MGTDLETDEPHHDHGATDLGRGALCGVDGDGGALWADAEAEDEAGDEEVLPGVGDALPDAGGEGDEGGEEDGASSAEVLVERCGEPAGDNAAAKLSRKEKCARECLFGFYLGFREEKKEGESQEVRT